MSGFSNMSADTRNKAIAMAVFVLLAAGIVYYELFAGGTPNPAANAPVAATPAAVENTPAAVAEHSTLSGSGAARRVGGSSAALDPALRMEGMLAAEQVVYSGVGRNIFSPNSAPPLVIPKPIAPARPIPAAVAPPVHTAPPGPPPIELTFFGTETDAAGKRQAILLHQDTVYTAQEGDVVLRRYKILAVDAKSIQVQDLVTHSTQTLPLTN